MRCWGWCRRRLHLGRGLREHVIGSGPPAGRHGPAAVGPFCWRQHLSRRRRAGGVPARFRFFDGCGCRRWPRCSSGNRCGVWQRGRHNDRGRRRHGHAFADGRRRFIAPHDADHAGKQQAGESARGTQAPGSAWRGGAAGGRSRPLAGRAVAGGDDLRTEVRRRALPGVGRVAQGGAQVRVVGHGVLVGRVHWTAPCAVRLPMRTRQRPGVIMSTPAPAGKRPCTGAAGSWRSAAASWRSRSRLPASARLRPR